MSKLKKVKNIAKAYSNKDPVEESWYQDRLKICKECPLFSENIPEEDLKIKHKLTIKSLGSVCTACGCPVRKKAGVKSEECGRVEIGKKPLWEAIEQTSKLDKNLKFINLDHNNLSMKVGKRTVALSMTSNKDDKVADFYFLIERKNGFDYKRYSAGCGCTTSEPEKIDKNTYKFSIRVSLKNFKSHMEEYNKSMTIYYVDNGKEKGVPLTLKITRKT